MPTRNFIRLPVCLFFMVLLAAPVKLAAQDMNSDSSGLKIFTLPVDSIHEFDLDISSYVSLCTPGTFDLYQKTGVLVSTKQPFDLAAVGKSFLQPVNDITMLFSIENPSPTARLIYFEFGQPDLLKIATLGDSTRQIQTGGFLGNSNKVSVFSPNRYLPLYLPPKATCTFLVYAKFIGSYKAELVPRLLGERNYQLNSIREIDKTRLQLIYHSFIMGGIFIISLFMFAQFFLNKDKAYLQYAAYGLFIFLLSEKIMELNCNINLVSYFIPRYVFYSHTILQLLACLFYTRFLVRLLEVTKKEKGIYTYTRLIQKLLLLGCLLYIGIFFFGLNSTYVALTYSYGALVSTVAMLPLLILLLLVKRKDLAVKFVIAGFSAVVITALIVVYINRRGLNTKFNLLAPISIIEFGIFIEMICFGLALGYKTYKQKLEKENIELQKKETEMAALKAQMNPHFIFNCINSIDAFIHSNDKYNATLYLNKFARLLRNILDSSKQNTIAFTKDMETLKLYIELEELRHENKFKTNISIDEELLYNDYKVPPLIIQPFVENAILHGIKNREGNNGLLEVHVKKSGDTIAYTIKDNGIGRKAAGKIIQNKETSYGVQLSYDRIRLFNKEDIPSVSIHDLYEAGIPTGTEVKCCLKII